MQTCSEYINAGIEIITKFSTVIIQEAKEEKNGIHKVKTETCNHICHLLFLKVGMSVYILTSV